MTRFRPFAAAALVALAPLAAQAQSSPLVGDWAIEFTAGMRIENDEPTALRAKGRLQIVQQGDSLIATLTVEPNEFVTARPPARFAAPKGTGNSAAFVQRSQATINTNGSESTATVVSTWSLSVNGDAIAGDVKREIEGMMGPGMPPQPISGTRIR